MRFIIGLGNPAPEYKFTKHNIGFAVVKNLAKENGIKINQKRHFSLLGNGKISSEEVTLALPQTYMNLSGNAVGELFAQKIKDIRDLIVVCDDINLELGKIRIRKQGSSGGHKGLGSLINTLGRNDFTRIRVGIATEVHRGDITRYVLSPFKRRDMRNVTHVISLATDAITCMVAKGVDIAMTKFNKRRVGTS